MFVHDQTGALESDGNNEIPVTWVVMVVVTLVTARRDVELPGTEHQNTEVRRESTQNASSDGDDCRDDVERRCRGRLRSAIDPILEAREKARHSKRDFEHTVPVRARRLLKEGKGPRSSVWCAKEVDKIVEVG